MTIDLERPPTVEHGSGGAVARRAIARWAWRLFWREWRQQLLILALIVVAVAATVVGAAVAVDTPPSPSANFGAAQDLATFSGSDPQLGSQIAALHHRFGALDVIENETLRVPGTLQTYDLRAQNPRGPFGQPLLNLVSGRFPTGHGQVAMTSGLASDFGLHVGDMWREGGTSRRVVGVVENPQSLLDEFALVAPGQVTGPTQVTVLFDAHGVPPQQIGPNVASVQSSRSTTGGLNPVTIVLALATVGMLLIALVSVGGFTVLAQRRLRSIGMLESVGATDKQVGFVVRANGIVVGTVGAVLGLALGVAAWLAYRPVVETDAHHVIAVWALPWVVIGPAMALAVVAAYVAASRPAHSVTKVPVVAALSGRPAPPKQVRRSAVPGVLLLVAAAVLFTLAARSNGQNGGEVEVVGAFVALIAAVIFLAPSVLAVLTRTSQRVPIAVRMALRDLARYRARSSSALAAISLGVLIAVIISVIAAGRYGNVLDYAGPNLASNQLILHTPTSRTTASAGTPSAPIPPSVLQAMGKTADVIAASLGSHEVVTLESTSATLQHAAKGRNYTGPLYVATPALLRVFGIAPSTVEPTADVLSMRPGLSSISKMQLVYNNYFVSHGGPVTRPGAFSCPKSNCLANPKIEELGALPSGTSAPNTVITERAVRLLDLHVATAGWFIQAPGALSAAQITSAREAAAATAMWIETKSSAPSSSEIINWATVFGIALALGILAMSVGLIRSETGSELRTLAAEGASSFARRTLTASTAGALALLGALIGTVCGYVAAIAWFGSTRFTGGFTPLTHAPVTNLLLILVGMPALAVAAGWLLAGREPPAMARQPLE